MGSSGHAVHQGADAFCAAVETHSRERRRSEAVFEQFHGVVDGLASEEDQLDECFDVALGRGCQTRLLAEIKVGGTFKPGFGQCRQLGSVRDMVAIAEGQRAGAGGGVDQNTGRMLVAPGGAPGLGLAGVRSQVCNYLREVGDQLASSEGHRSACGSTRDGPGELDVCLVLAAFDNGRFEGVAECIGQAGKGGQFALERPEPSFLERIVYAPGAVLDSEADSGVSHGENRLAEFGLMPTQSLVREEIETGVLLLSFTLAKVALPTFTSRPPIAIRLHRASSGKGQKLHPLHSPLSRLLDCGGVRACGLLLRLPAQQNATPAGRS